ncbi:MAG: toll/interleukin-1 receptor domain-containing protein [Pseudomonadota bacterium]
MKVFVSYRRQGEQGFVGRLTDRLAAAYGADKVFRDAVGLRPGVRFEREILSRLSESQAVVVVIGPQWAGRRLFRRARLHDPQDWVRRELEHALASGIPIIPVLIGDTPMPDAGQLPPSLHGLLAVQAARLHDASWDADTALLLQSLEAALQHAPSDQVWRRLEGDPAVPGGGDRPLRLVLWGAAAMALVSVLFVLVQRHTGPAPAPPPPAPGVDLARPDSWVLPAASAARSQTAHLALRMALLEMQASTREATGANDGYNVSKFTARFPAADKLPWSSAFVTWCYLDALQRRKNDRQARLPFADSLSAQQLFQSLAAKRWALQPFDGQQARPGDIVFFEVGPRIGHAEIVYAVAQGQVCSIGGNVGNQVSGRCRSLTTASLAGLGAVPPDAID